MWKNGKKMRLIFLLFLIAIAGVVFINVSDNIKKNKDINTVKNISDVASRTDSTGEAGETDTNDSTVNEESSSDTDASSSDSSVVSKRLEQNLLSNKSVEPINQSQSVKIVAAGDILLGRGVEYHINRVQKDFTYPFRNVADILRKGDVVFANLEAPLTESTKSLDPNGKIVLKSPQKAADGIKYAGFNVLNLANNHIMDYYEEGLLDTIEVLEKHGIAYAGAGKNINEARQPAIIEKNGLKVAVLSYTDMAELTFKGNPMLSFAADEDKSGVAPRKYELIKEDMDSIRENADILIISLHWGVENSFSVTEEQREFAYRLIDDGADIILGHHPHRFQGVEIYNGKPIIYSLGNFIFDQNDPNNQESFIVHMELKDKKLSYMQLIPVRTIEKNHIIIPKGDDAIEMLKRELELCGKLGSKCAIVNDIIEFNIK
jgi:poly-gamma-glutamate capsule biosynthesis protein CapA/YwtB (metallophosphatase superfamily)